MDICFLKSPSEVKTQRVTIIPRGHGCFHNEAQSCALPASGRLPLPVDASYGEVEARPRKVAWSQGSAVPCPQKPIFVKRNG
jgi:hypothetical protein